MIVRNGDITVSADMFGALHIRNGSQSVVVPFEGLGTLFDALRPFNVRYPDKNIVTSDEFWLGAPFLTDTPRGQEWHTMIQRRGSLFALVVGDTELESFSRACFLLAGLRAVVGLEVES